MSLNFIDLTRPICTTTTPPTIYPGDPVLEITPHAKIKDDGYSVHTLRLGTHTATHVDAPAHFIEGGRTIDEIGLDELVGSALVVDMSTMDLKPRQKIEWEDLEKAWTHGTKGTGDLSSHINSGKYKMLLVHTGWKYPNPSTDCDGTSPGTSSQAPAFFDHPYFSSSVAERLISPTSQVRLFGSDTPNPDETPFNDVGGADGYAFHELLLGADGLIAENLTNLDKLVAKPDSEEAWKVSIVPLKIVGVDASPVRAFASR